MTHLDEIIARLLTATPADVDGIVEELEAMSHYLTAADRGRIRGAVHNLTIADARRVLAI